MASPFQSEFKGNEKLKACAVNDADHVSERHSPKGEHVLLIKKALNAWAKKAGIPELALTEIYDNATSERVMKYKRDFKPKPILNYNNEIDPIVGKKTVVALDSELPPSELSIKPLDLLIYITGKADDVGLGGSTLKQGQSAEFDQLLGIAGRTGRTLQKLGIGGSLENNFGADKAFDLIKISTFPGSDQRIILYGYSAGAMQLMEVCRRLVREHIPNPLFPNPFGLFFEVDLLVTIDAAAGTQSVNRSVAGCVRKNINFFQTSFSLGLSRGAPNVGGVGAEGKKPVIDNRNMDGQLQAFSSTDRHHKINDLAHPIAFEEIKKFIHS